MQKKTRPYILTFLSSGLVVLILGFIGIEVALNFIENKYIELQLDVNQRYAEHTSNILKQKIREEVSTDQALASYQKSIEKTSTERGFVCVLDNSSSKLVCHPNPDMIGMSVDSDLFKFYSKIKHIKNNRFSNIIREGKSQGGILKYVNQNKTEIAYMVPIPGTKLMVSVHENLENIKNEIHTFRKAFYLGAILIGLLLAIGVTFAARIISSNYEKRILGINDSLEKKVRERTQELVDAYYKIEIANEELSKLDSTKSDFLLLINHEMRTPLNGIIGITDILEDSDLNSEQKELLRTLKKSNSRLLRFAQTALLLTELKTVSNTTQLSEISIIELIESAINQNKEKLDEKNIRIEKKLCKQHIELISDNHLIKKCLTIILDNAIRYSPNNKEIKIHSFISNQSDLNIAISDQGPGFSDEAIEKLFKYFSSDNMKHHAEGLGLGLAIVKLIMDLHKGNVMVENIENEGAKVNLSFPINH
ncbi:MAG: hypothetical protein JEZ03_05390 [Bacteroidales bacterium]|nr:hypothetical protein [Bacteroidales bacterium]